MENEIDLPVIVLTWNRPECLRRWLETLEKLEHPTGFRKRGVIVDNGSWDTTPEVISDAVRKEIIRANDVHFLDANVGFAKAHNHVFRRLMMEDQLQFIATLNEDAEADPQWLVHLVSEACEHSGEKVGMWGGPILTSRSRPDTVSSNGHLLRKRDAAFLDVDWNRRIDDTSLCCKRNDYKPFSACIAAALWSIKMLREVGILDNDQFMYYDEVELAYRARLHGWTAKWVPDAKAFHPLPKPKQQNTTMWRHQCRGRLAIILRYLPDKERTRILANLPNNEREVLDYLRQTGRDLRPRFTDEERSKIWEDWADRYEAKANKPM